MNRNLSFMALSVAVVLAGCSTSGNTGVPPTQQTADLGQNKLQFAVGTANIAGTLGLNTVVTYRQPNGQDGTLVNTPTITGPAGFVNTAPATNASGAVVAGPDSGTNMISGSPQPMAGVAASPSTLGAVGGAFAYGLQPDNSNVGGGVSFARYALPIYAAGTVSPYAVPPTSAITATAIPYIGGPPAFPNVRNASFPSGFTGYPLGFTDFLVKPVAGSYTLALNVPTGFDAAGKATSMTVSAAGALASLALLPPFTAPTFVPDGTGGGSISVTVPAGVTEALVILQDRDGGCYPGSNGAPAYYSFRTTTVGPQVIPVPSNLGPTFGPQTTTPTICTSAQNTPPPPPPPAVPPAPNAGDRYRIYAVGFDYPALEAGPPTNTSVTPVITGANGQADITTSTIRTGTST